MSQWTAPAAGPAGDQLCARLPSPAAPPPSLFHRRARRSYVTIKGDTFLKNSTINNLWGVPPASDQSPPVKPTETDRGPAENNFKLPPPNLITIDNKPVTATKPPPSWPFHPGPSRPPRYIWGGSAWEEAVNENGNWKAVTPSRPLNPQAGLRLLYVFIYDVWVLITSVDILWDKTTNSFHSPQQLLQYQPNSVPTYAWVNNKLVEIVNKNNQWIEASPEQGYKGSSASQGKDQIGCVWDTETWVLCKLLDLLATHMRPPQYGSGRPGEAPSGSLGPSDGSHKEGLISPLQKVVEPPAKPPLPPPSGSVDQGEAAGRPPSENFRPSYGPQSGDMLMLPPIKVGEQSGKHQFLPPPPGSEGLWSSGNKYPPHSGTFESARPQPPYPLPQGAPSSQPSPPPKPNPEPQKPRPPPPAPKPKPEPPKPKPEPPKPEPPKPEPPTLLGILKKPKKKCFYKKGCFLKKLLGLG